MLQHLLAEVVSSLQHLRNKVWWKRWCPQQPKYIAISTWSNPALVHQVATTHFATALTHSVGILSFPLKINTAGLSVWVCISHEAAKEIFQQSKKIPCGELVPQRDGGNAALGYEAFHPTPPLWQGYSWRGPGELFEGWLQIHPITGGWAACVHLPVQCWVWTAGRAGPVLGTWTWERFKWGKIYFGL